MKKITILLSLILVFALAILSGCGSSTSSSDKFIGTWETNTKLNYHVVTIEKKSDTTYYLTHYVIDLKENKYAVNSRELTTDDKDKNVLKMNGGSKVVINKDGNLEILKDKMTYTKKSDKILDVNELTSTPLKRI